MKLRSLLINNFRGIDSLQVRFEAAEGKAPQNLVAFAGPNACGKTSILEAILICMGRADLMPRQTDPKHDVMTTSSGFFLEAEMTGRQDIIITAESGLEGTVTHSVRLPAEASEHTHVAATKRQTALPAFPVAYFSSWRAPRLVGPVPITAGKPGRRPSKTEENRLWRLKSYFVNLKAREAFIEAPSQPRENHAGRGLLHRLNETWRLFYPNAPYRFEAGTASANIEEGFEFYANPKDDPRFRIPVDSLSSGEIEVLVFLASFLVEDSDGILLIDEPELHLHPAWHRMILGAIRSLLPETQIICGTHSPQVLSELPIEQVRLLKRQGPLTIASIPEDSYGLDVNRVLEELMDSTDRPREIKDRLRQLFDLVDRGDLLAARRLAALLQGTIHADPELTRAGLLIRRKEILTK